MLTTSKGKTTSARGVDECRRREGESTEGGGGDGGRGRRVTTGVSTSVAVGTEDESRWRGEAGGGCVGRAQIVDLEGGRGDGGSGRRYHFPRPERAFPRVLVPRKQASPRSTFHGVQFVASKVTNPQPYSLTLDANHRDEASHSQALLAVPSRSPAPHAHSTLTRQYLLTLEPGH
jgi:hypothetical protein